MVAGSQVRVGSMIDLLLSLIPGGGLTAIATAILAALAGIFGIYRSGHKAGQDKQKAKEANDRAQNLDRIRDAADAQPRDVLSDKRNRDNWR